MKTLKDFLLEQSQPEAVEDVVLHEEFEASDEPLYEDDGRQNHNHPMDPPAILVMRRKYIRQFPNNQRVAMYYVDKINKYVTVPYTAMQWTNAGENEETEYSGEYIEENIIHYLKNIVDGHTAKSYKFTDGKTMKIDTQTANAVLKVHGALNDENKKKVSDMAKKSKQHFGKVVDFAMKHLK